ncbi:MAG: sulfurtransferase [Chloroflexi bacterium]|nr:sulfurtransferase [Chloroflexota bacterium]
MSECHHPESLASAQWVADHLANPSVRVVEVIWGDGDEWGTAAYRSGHIPGAAVWDFATELQDPARNDIVGPDGYAALLARAGVNPDTTVVVYSGLSNLLATFAFWLLKVYGHRDVRLLGGDRRKWLAEGRPRSREAPIIAATSYAPQPADGRLRARRDEVLRTIGQENVLLVDARSPEMFGGTDKAGAARGGHIPGAVNLAALREAHADGSFKAWRTPTVREDGTFKPADELQALFSGLGIERERAIITYCVRGGLSTHAWFVLTQLLGYPNVREYDRSWVEWGNREDTPIAQ